MSRNRLTDRVATDMKSKPGAQVEDKDSKVDNDVYNMNNPEHEKNDPKIDEYAKGEPEAWAEGVNKDKVNKDDQKREDTGHAPLIDKHAAVEAIARARALEEKAVKALIASQRILPGATDELIEKQAAILMHLPEEGLNATLNYQESLAKMIAKAASESAEDEEKEEKEEKEENKEEEKVEEKDASAKEEDKEDLKTKVAALQEQVNILMGKLAAKEEDKDEDAASKEAAKEEDKDEDAAKEEDKDEDKDEDAAKEEDKDEDAASKEASLLDQIFSEVIPSTNKKGASSLSGMVKKEASTNNTNDLSNLWGSAPDISNIF